MNSDRRNFMKGLAGVAGSLLLGAGGTASAAMAGAPAVPATASSARLRAGVLLTASELRPRAATDLLAGIRAALRETPGVTLHADLLGSEPAALREARRLAQTAASDVVVLNAHPGTAATLAPAAAAAGIRLLAVDTGANVVRLDERSAAVTNLDLGQWRADWSLGRWAAGALGQRAVIVTSLYDTGYDLSWAFQAGFEAGGGAVLATLLTDPAVGLHAGKGGPDGVARVLTAIRELAPDVIHLLHSGADAGLFVRELARSGAPGRLVASDPVLSDALVRDAGPALAGAVTARAWRPDPGFAASYRAERGREPTGHAALGYAAGRALAALAGGTDDPEAESGLLSGGVQLLEAFPGIGYLRQGVVKELAAVDPAAPAVRLLEAAARSGWSTPWLVT